jgi:Fur family peroxide stress response transcriptional regulator
MERLTMSVSKSTFSKKRSEKRHSEERSDEESLCQAPLQRDSSATGAPWARNDNPGTSPFQTASKRDLYLNALRQAGRRITEQRRLVCTYLAETTTHPSASQIFSALHSKHPEISRATVYNTLNVLQSLGAILAIGFGADHTHYDTDTLPHVNLICLRCHEIEDYHGPLAVSDLPAAAEAATGFRAVAVRVDVIGFCTACRERKKSEIREQWLARQQGTAEADLIFADEDENP